MRIDLFRRACRVATVFTAALGAFCPGAHAFYATPYQWPNGTIPLTLALGPAGRTLSDGSTSWDMVAQRAADDWNGNLGLVRFAATVNDGATQIKDDKKNTVTFSDTIDGDDFGDETIAVTLLHYSVGPDGTVMNASEAAILETDVLVNRQFTFDSYDGPLRIPATTTDIDLHRVLLHEFGHILGLDHPDKIGQSVEAIMNSVIGDTDQLTADDIAGTTSIYRDPALKSLSIKIADLAVDNGRGKVYLSLPKGSTKGFVRVIDPYSKQIVASIRTGAAPNVLRLSAGGEHLYLGVDGLGVIDQIDPDTLATTLQFALGAQAGVRAADIAVLPGAPESVLVSQVGNRLGAQQQDGSPEDADFAVYDSGVLRPEESFNSGAEVGSPLFLDEAGQTFYAITGGYTSVDDSLAKLTLEAGGVSQYPQSNYLYIGNPSSAVYSHGQLFLSDDGVVADLGRAVYDSDFPDISNLADGAEAVAVDGVLGQAYFPVGNVRLGVGDGQPAVLVEDIASRSRIGGIHLPRYIKVSRIARWGVNGLLLSLDDQQLLFIRSNLVAPGSVTDVPPTVALGVPKFGSLNENSGVKDKLTVTRADGDLSSPLTVHYIVSGTAQSGVDYRPLRGVVTIPAGQATAQIKIVPLGSQFSDGPRTLQIRLAPDNAYRWGASSAAVITFTGG